MTTMIKNFIKNLFRKMKNFGTNVPADETANSSPEEQYKTIKEKALQGDAYYMTDLGLCYLEGIGTAQDTNEGLYWMQKAADCGDPMGLNNMGFYYHKGIYVPINMDKAIFYYKKASNLKCGKASCNLGSLYQDAENYQEAKFYYEQAVEQGEWLAISNLAYLYLNGKGVDKDYFKAADLFRDAAEKNALTKKDSEAYYLLLLKIYCEGVLHFKNGNVGQANGYLRKASNHGCKPASKFILLNKSLDGFMLPPHITRNFPQIDYIEMSIINSNYEKFNYSSLKETIKGAERDEADELCYAAVYVMFGILDLEGLDHIELLKRSISRGFITAYFWLGYCYENGLGIEKSEENAEACYMKVIENGNPEPLWNEGLFTGRLDGIEVDESYYRIALMRYKSKKYKTEEIRKMLSGKYAREVLHTQSLMLIVKCLIDEGKTLDDSEVMDIVELCANYKNDEALLLLSQHYYNKSYHEEAFINCIKALEYGNIEAINIFQELFKAF